MSPAGPGWARDSHPRCYPDGDDGQSLLAVDAGSNQISVLRIGADGSLTPVPGSPFASGGVEPDSIAVNNGLVYVSNTGAGGTNYTGFTLSWGGQLRPIPGSTVSLPDGSGPGDVVLNGDNTKLVGTRVNTSLIDSFTLNRDERPDGPTDHRSPRRASAHSAASSAPPIPTSCLFPTPTTTPPPAPRAMEQSRRSTMHQTAL